MSEPGGPGPEAAPDPDPTTPLAVPSVGESIGRYAEEKWGGARRRLRQFAPPGPPVDNRLAAALALAGGLLAAGAAYLPWIVIEIAGRSGPGSHASGLDGRDGVTVLVVGLLAVAVGVVLATGRGYVWLKMAMFATGGIVTVIGIVDLIDVHAKAEALERRFGIPQGVVTATAGVGLWLVVVAGVMMLVAGLVARRSEASLPQLPPAPPPVPDSDAAAQVPAPPAPVGELSRPGSPG
jgi:hypothetical protein